MTRHETAVVSRYEADLLTLLHIILGHRPRTELGPLLADVATRERPKLLSRTAVELIQDTLAKGLTLQLARGGIRRERFLRGEQIAEGRIWQRTSPASLGFEFSPRSLNLLMDVLNNGLPSPRKARGLPPLTLGDSWLHTEVYDAFRNLPLGTVLRERGAWQNDAWCQLNFAAEFSATNSSPALQFGQLFTPAGIALLEASQPRLASVWIAMEQTKAAVAEPANLRTIALSQDRVLAAFFAAVERAGRRDLCRFLLTALRRLLRPGVTAKSWLPALKPDGRLADRQLALRHGLTFLHQTHQRFADWQTESRSIGYFDEGYQAAQLWKADWETYNGEEIVAAARRVLAQTEWT